MNLNQQFIDKIRLCKDILENGIFLNLITMITVCGNIQNQLYDVRNCSNWTQALCCIALCFKPPFRQKFCSEQRVDKFIKFQTPIQSRIRCRVIENRVSTYKKWLNSHQFWEREKSENWIMFYFWQWSERTQFSFWNVVDSRETPQVHEA